MAGISFGPMNAGSPSFVAADAEEGSGVQDVEVEFVDEDGETITLGLQDIMETEEPETQASPPPAQQTEQPPRRTMGASVPVLSEPQPWTAR